MRKSVHLVGHSHVQTSLYFMEFLGLLTCSQMCIIGADPEPDGSVCSLICSSFTVYFIVLPSVSNTIK